MGFFTYGRRVYIEMCTESVNQKLETKHCTLEDLFYILGWLSRNKTKYLPVLYVIVVDKTPKQF